MKRIQKIALALIVLTSFAFITPEKPKTKKTVAVIDVSHGGLDLGSNEGKLSEKQIVEQISQKIAILNDAENVEIHFTRTHDEFVTLQNRVDFINQLTPDVVISLHVNQSENKELSGTELYISDHPEHFEKSTRVAELFKENIQRIDLFETTKIKKANFFILKNAKAPAVLLELGFLSNQDDRSVLANEEKQFQIASAILRSLSEVNK